MREEARAGLWDGDMVDEFFKMLAAQAQVA
jgi:hypothetical protein